MIKRFIQKLCNHEYEVVYEEEDLQRNITYMTVYCPKCKKRDVLEEKEFEIHKKIREIESSR